MKKIFIYGDREKLANYVTALEKAGAEVICSFDTAESKNCDALLLSGGADIDPKLYGQENTASVGIDHERDAAEYELIGIFREMDKPILGICRGHQVIGAYFGAELIQHIPNYERHAWTETAQYDKVHPMRAEEGSFLHKLYGAEFMGNSAHHQAVAYLPDGFKLAATSDDGIIDGMYNEELRIYSTQFHPERMCHELRRDDTVDGSLIFDFFMSII